MGITITEALAEIKTLNKRIEKKIAFISGYLIRQEGVKDPLEKQGGSIKVIEIERQSINDLMERIVFIRTAIAKANNSNEISIEGTKKTIAEWLVWRREVAPLQRVMLENITKNLNHYRNEAKKQGVAFISAQASTAESKPTDLVVSIDELALANELETFEKILGTLDGQLSLANATIQIEE